ncbi:ZIP family metal transporter [Reichenbachiella sp. MALMAid0571]|uniref:ZIP family metal transporter n=1 Tax=Reichenbachiella sp. MALMAid0571 TaxID=3143939 RepID=UPI0032DF17A2
MIFNSIVLFICAMVGGLLVYGLDKKEGINIKLILIFGGSYLFSITIIHILPELYQSEASGMSIGLFVLLGFFFQNFLEYFTSGVEHGHMHAHKHSHTSVAGYSLMIALCLHAFLEGTFLAYPNIFHDHGSKSGSLLIGVVLHKIPAALALMSVLTCQFDNKKFQIFLLVLFSLASPFGLIAGSYIKTIGFMEDAGLLFLFAFVGGNFLHISTTIFIESSPEHNWNFKRLLVSIGGAAVAVLAEMYV